jgi:hypothetical protein
MKKKILEQNKAGNSVIPLNDNYAVQAIFDIDFMIENFKNGIK